jgi:mono/diheme cytochrome c family protein
MKHSAMARESGRKTPLWILLFLLAVGPQYASAQQAGDGLNETQRHGRQLLAQSCGICHLPPELGARTYGPPLNKLAGGGDDDIMREYITNGTPRMPSFKSYLKSTDIDAIISYVRTVPAPAAPAAR